MARAESIEYVILSSRGDQSFAYSEPEMRKAVGVLLNAPKMAHEDGRKVAVFSNRQIFTPCEYTHSHTQNFCGNPGCREA